MIKRLLDRAALVLLSNLPVPLMRHLMFLLRSHPEVADRWGYHIRPAHYYEPLPDFRAITPSQIERRRDYPAIDFHWPEQLRLVEALGATYGMELAALAATDAFDFANGYFAGFDAAVYYAMIRHLKPAQIVEIGAGYSSRIADRALGRNRQEGFPGKLVCIEPHPEPRLTDAHLEIELIAKPVEEIPVEFFARLGANDILFIDSSHTVKFGGDVCREFLEILPALKPGVWVHVHDIFFPQDYPAEWLIDQRLAFNEQYFVEVFLAYNRHFAVALCNHWLCLDHALAAAALWPMVAGSERSNQGASFWMTRG